MTTYHIGISFTNSFEVEANSIEEAAQLIRDKQTEDLTFDADFSINYIDVLTE